MNLQFFLHRALCDSCSTLRDAIPVAHDAIRVERDGGNLHLSGTVDVVSFFNNYTFPCFTSILTLYLVDICSSFPAKHELRHEDSL